MKAMYCDIPIIKHRNKFAVGSFLDFDESTHSFLIDFIVDDETPSKDLYFKVDKIVINHDKIWIDVKNQALTEFFTDFIAENYETINRCFSKNFILKIIW